MPALDRADQRRVLVAALMLPLAGAPNAATAQSPSPQPAVPSAGLSRDDVNRMRAAAARLYEGRSIGTVERWRNPETQNAGVVKLVRKFEADGMPCRRLEYVIRFRGKETAAGPHYAVDWCKTASGDWKMTAPAPSPDGGATPR